MAELITTGELARRIGKSSRTIYRWLEQGVLAEPVRVGTVRMFDWEKVARRLKRRSVGRQAELMELHAEVKRSVRLAKRKLGGRRLPDIATIIREGRGCR